MKKPKLKFSQKMFYTLGKYSFFVMFIVSVIRVIDTWKIVESYDIVAMFASSVFNFALFQLFAFLERKEIITELSEEDISQMNKVLDELNLKENDGKEQRK